MAWILSTLLALFPLLPGVDYDDFYAQSGICIYLPLSIVRRSGWEYSMIMFVGVNFLLFLGILIGQISIFVEVVRVGNNVRSTKTNQREASLAGTLFAIVLTDVLCWIPIGTIGKKRKQKQLCCKSVELSPLNVGMLLSGLKDIIVGDSRLIIHRSSLHLM
jgi:hypothetical protein